MPDKFQAPSVHDGEIIEYSLRPTPLVWKSACVREQRADAVEAMPVAKFGNKNASPSELLHESDPRLQDRQWVERHFNEDNSPEYKGVWRLGPQRRRLDALEAKVAILEALIGTPAEAEEAPVKRRPGRPAKNHELEPVTS